MGDNISTICYSYMVREYLFIFKGGCLFSEMCQESGEWWYWAQTLHRAIFWLLVMHRQMCKYLLPDYIDICYNQLKKSTIELDNNNFLWNMHLQVAPKLFKKLKWCLWWCFWQVILMISWCYFQRATYPFVWTLAPLEPGWAHELLCLCLDSVNL